MAAAQDGKGQQELTEWAPLEIELAKARCTRLLKDLDAVLLPEAPFRKGECGTPAPVRLVSVGRNPPVAITPPALVSCDMVVSLHKWVKETLKPLARKQLGADVARIEVMSDYSCRHAYGRIGNRLSEHGRANALDIRGFVTAKGKTAYVLGGWGRTERDIAAELAAKAAAEKAVAEKAVAEAAEAERLEKEEPPSGGTPGATTGDTKVRVLKPTGAVGNQGAAAPGPRVKTTIVEGVPKREAKLSAAKPDQGAVRSDAQQAIGEARRLGGPKAAAPRSRDPYTRVAKASGSDGKAGAGLPSVTAGAPVPTEPASPTERFLREAHRAACRIFGTTLGPEANEAHRNHFHVDMAERRLRRVCD